MAIDTLVSQEELRLDDASSPLGKTAKRLHEQLGSHVLAIIAYGSWTNDSLRKPDSMKDYVVVVDKALPFYRENPWLFGSAFVPFVRNSWVQAFLNWFSPNFYHVTNDSSEKVKIGVVTEGHLRGQQHSPVQYLGLRLTKPVKVFYCNERLPLKSIMAELRQENLERTLNLMPHVFSLTDFAVKYVGVSYQSDIRPEDPNKVNAIYQSREAWFNEISEAYLSGQPERMVACQSGVYTNFSPAYGRIAANSGVYLRKLAFGLCNLKNFFTATDPIGYVKRKISLSTRTLS